MAASGDATFAIDEVAEEAIVSFIEREKLSIAYYSEDKGLIEFGTSPEAVLVIDPIDGTRPAIAGFEQCVVSVAWADYTPDVTMGDVRFGCIGEIKSDDLFWAERGPRCPLDRGGWIGTCPAPAASDRDLESAADIRGGGPAFRVDRDGPERDRGRQLDDGRLLPVQLDGVLADPPDDRAACGLDGHRQPRLAGLAGVPCTFSGTGLRQDRSACSRTTSRPPP